MAIFKIQSYSPHAATAHVGAAMAKGLERAVLYGAIGAGLGFMANLIIPGKSYATLYMTSLGLTGLIVGGTWD